MNDNYNSWHIAKEVMNKYFSHIKPILKLRFKLNSRGNFTHQLSDIKHSEFKRL